MTPRIRRLYSDAIQLTKLSEVSPKIWVCNAVGSPPSQFDVQYDIVGLSEINGKIVEKRGHTARVKLPSGYPREAPTCHMLSPVYHPNIAPHAICIVDYWTAGESLPELVIRIGEMIAYQTYNIKSPLNGDAAKYATEKLSSFPVDSSDLGSAFRRLQIVVTDEDIERAALGQADGPAAAPPPPAQPKAAAAPPAPVKAPVAGTIVDACENCGQSFEGGQAHICAGGHVVCRDCVVVCQKCGSARCVQCTLGRCAECKAILCEDCAGKCSGCGRELCPDHLGHCASCGCALCSACAYQCGECGKTVCWNDYRVAERRCVACEQAAPEPIPAFVPPDVPIAMTSAEEPTVDLAALAAADVAVIEPLAPVVEEPAPLVEEPAPLVEEPAPLVEEPAPLVEEPAPLVEVAVKEPVVAAVAVVQPTEWPCPRCGFEVRVTDRYCQGCCLAVY